MNIYFLKRSAPFALALFLLFGCAGQPELDPALVADTGVVLDGYKVYRVSEQNECFDLQLDYPRLERPNIDEGIRAWINEKYAAVTMELRDICERRPPEKPIKVWAEYDLYTTSRTVSLVFKSWIYAEGGDQYHDSVDTLNFLWNSGAAIGYGDIFASTGGLLPSLSQEVRRDLRRELGELWEDEPKYAAALEDPESSMQNFVITRDGLTIYFPTRKIAPFYAGPQQSTVPLERLSRFRPNPDVWE